MSDLLPTCPRCGISPLVRFGVERGWLRKRRETIELCHECDQTHPIIAARRARADSYWPAEERPTTAP